MHPDQPVNARTVFHGCHNVQWDSNDEIYVLGADHKTCRWSRTSAGMYRLVEELP